MKKRVILIADLDSEFASDVLESLTAAGIVVSACKMGDLVGIHPELHSGELQEMPLIAVVCELPQLSTLASIRSFIQPVRELWPEIPLVACPTANSRGFKTKSKLIKAGFRAVAETAAQLPALLREVEENPGNEEEQEPFKAAPDRNAFELPDSIRKRDLKSAFSLIATLHLAGNQKEAASLAIAGIAQMIKAQRWSIYVADHSSVRREVELELLATQVSSEEAPLAGAPSTVEASGLAQQAVSRVECIKRASGKNWILAVPLVCGERVHGVLEGIRQRPESRSFVKSDLAMLDVLTTAIAASLSNSARVAEAERLSLTDELTRLHNARYLRQFLVNEMKRARRFGSRISALFLDLDDFKTVNDMHGHLAGSHVLMEVASLILPSVRDTDCVVRYGGDEFVVILPETGFHEALRVADRIRCKIERHRFNGGRRLRVHLTSSIGVAIFPDEALSPHQLIACSDRAMYAAKAANKNCVRAMTPMPPPPTETRVSEESLEGPQFQRIPDEKFIS